MQVRYANDDRFDEDSADMGNGSNLYQNSQFSQFSQFSEYEEDDVEAVMHPVAGFFMQTLQYMRTLFAPSIVMREVYTIECEFIPYATEQRRYQIAPGIWFSTGNAHQLAVLRHMNLEPYVCSDYYDYDSESNVRCIVRALNDFRLEAIDLTTVRDALYHYHSSSYARSECQDFGDDEPDDLLARRIANTLADTYYHTLDISLQDVMACFQAYIPEPDIENIDHIHPELIARIKKIKIDRGRMTLQTLLPADNILEAAVDALKPSIWTQFKRYIQQLFWKKNDTKASYALAEDKDAKHFLTYNFLRYKKVTTHTLNDYISWWKAPFTAVHHHDMRARVVQAEVLTPHMDSVIKIRQLLERQCDLIDPAKYNQDGLWDGNSQAVHFQDPAVNRKWNDPEQVVHHSRSYHESGFYQTLSKAHMIDPNDLPEDDNTPASCVEGCF